MTRKEPAVTTAVLSCATPTFAIDLSRDGGATFVAGVDALNTVRPMLASRQILMEPASKVDSPPVRWRRARKFLFWTIVLELACLTVVVVALLVGEHSRLSLLVLYAPRQPLLAVAVLAAVLAPLTRRCVRLLVSLQCVACLVVIFPVMGLHLGTRRTSEFPIRLATYNVFFGKVGRPALLDEIAAMPADIILLQATSRRWASG